MTEIAEKAIDTTLEGCEQMQGFFDETKLLKQACDETGLDLPAVRHNLKGDAEKIKIMYAVILIKWMHLWEAGAVERKTLSKYIPEQLKA